MKSLSILIISAFILSGCGQNQVTFIFEPNNGDLIFEMSQSSLNELPVPEKPNHRFVGWHVDSNLSSVFNYNVFLSGRSSQNRIFLYAKWSDEYNITLHPNNGNESSSISFNFSEQIKLPSPTNYGYELVAWFYDEELTVPYASKLMPSEDFELYAKWEIGSYQLSFYSHDLRLLTSSVSNFDSSIRLITPERFGYTFGYWFEEGSNVPFIESRMPGYDVNLYPIWNPYQYTIRFDFPGVPSRRVQYDETVNLPSPTREFYRFVGWMINDRLINQRYSHNSDTIPKEFLQNESELVFSPIWEDETFLRQLYFEERDLGGNRSQISYFAMDNRLLMYADSFNVRRYHRNFGTHQGYLDVTNNLQLSLGEGVVSVTSDQKYTVVLTSAGRLLIDVKSVEGCNTNLGNQASFGFIDNLLLTANAQIEITHQGVFVLTERVGLRNSSLYRIHHNCFDDTLITDEVLINEITPNSISRIASNFYLFFQTAEVNPQIKYIDEDFVVRQLSTNFGDIVEDRFTFKNTDNGILVRSVKTGFLYLYSPTSVDNLRRVEFSGNQNDLIWYSASTLGITFRSFANRDYVFTDQQSLYVTNVTSTRISTRKVMDFPSSVGNIIHIQQIGVYNGNGDNENSFEPHYLLINSNEQYYVVNGDGLFRQLVPPYRGIVRVFSDGIVVTRDGLNIVGDLPFWRGSITYGDVSITSTSRVYVDWRPFLGENNYFTETDLSPLALPNSVNVFRRSHFINSLYTDPLTTQRYYDNQNNQRLMNLIAADIPLFVR